MMGVRIRLLGLLAMCSLTLASVSAYAGAGAEAAGLRDVPVALSPSPGDLTLLQIRFPHGGHGELVAGAVGVHVVGAFGDDYLALAMPRRGHSGGRQVLLVLANRPSALLDPVTVHLRVLARRALGAPSLRRVNDPLRHPPAHRAAWLCSLTVGTAPLRATALHRLAGRGPEVGGFGPDGAVAAAYDAACGLTDGEAFKRALAGQTPPGGGPGSGEGCTGTSCEPPPVQPVPGPPGCAPCDPRPGTACPLVASTAICVAGRDEISRAAAAAAH